MSKRRRAGDDDDGSGKEAAAHRAAAASSAQAAAAPGGAPQSEAAYLSGLTARTVARGAGFGALRDASAPASSGRIRLLSYNVNSLRKRATEPHFAAWLRAAAPDVLCLQEVKIRRAGELRSALLEGGCGGGAWKLGSTSAFAAREDGVCHGTATLLPAAAAAGAARVDVLRAHADWPAGLAPSLAGEDFATRLVTAWLGPPLNIVLVNVYAPNSGDGYKKAARRAVWDDAFLGYCRALLRDGGAGLAWPSAVPPAFAAAAPAPPAVDFARFAGRVIAIGDFNVTPDIGLDAAPSPAPGDEHIAGMSPAERAGFARLLREAPLHDAWRERNPGARGATWFSDTFHGTRSLAARSATPGWPTAAPSSPT
jgi:exonuclease III